MSTTDQSGLSSADFEARARSYHLFDEELGAPHELYAGLRGQCPIARSDVFGGFWIMSRYDDIHEVLTDSKHFTAKQSSIPDIDWEGGGQIPLNLDPPDHKLYRRDLNSFFSPQKINANEERSRTLARSLLESFAAKGGGDFVKDFCVPLPATMFLLMLGAPLEDSDRLLYWKHQIIHEGFSGDPEKVDFVMKVVRPECMAYFDGLLEERVTSENPPDDVLTGLAHASVGDRPYTRDEQLRTILLMMAAGLDTVTSALSTSLCHLATHPDARRQLAADPSLIPSAVEEFLRYFTAVTVVRRCKADTEVSGTTIKAGEPVLLALPSADRDGAEFADPDDLDFTRAPNRHLAFGGGPHRCLGSHLARMEMRVAFEELINVMPEFELAPGFSPLWHYGIVHGVDELQVVIP